MAEPSPTTALPAGFAPARVWALGAALAVLWVCVPALASRSIVDMLVFTALYTIAGLGVSFLLGQCGIVSLAQSVFYGIGAYSSAYCATHFGWPMPVGLLIGIGLSATIAAAVGWPVLRLSGYFLALATLALAIIAQCCSPNGMGSPVGRWAWAASRRSRCSALR